MALYLLLDRSYEQGLQAMLLRVFELAGFFIEIL